MSSIPDRSRRSRQPRVKGSKRSRSPQPKPSPEVQHVLAEGWYAIAGGKGHGTYRFEPDDDDARVLPDTLVITEIREDERGAAVEFGARVIPPNGRERVVTIPASVISVRNHSDELRKSAGWNITPNEARQIASLLRAVDTQSAIPRKRVLTRPCWRGKELLVPGCRIPFRESDSWFRAYGRRARRKEAKAKECWQEIVEIGSENPKLAMALGVPFGSLFLGPLGRTGFVFHPTSDSRAGKTSSMEIAMAELGPPGDLVRTWNATPKAIGERLRMATILPVALDELATASVPDEDREALIFRAAGGGGRDRARQTGGLEPTSDSNLILFTTGEQSLRDVSGLTGAAARVLEIRAPMTTTAGEVEKAVKLAGEVYGWPLYWLHSDPRLAQLRRDYQTVKQALEQSADTALQRTLAGHLAVLACGFTSLARMVGLTRTRPMAINAAEVVFAEIKEDLEERGERAADRLFAAIEEAMSRAPNRWHDNAEDTSDSPPGGWWGVLFELHGEPVVGLYSKPLSEIAADVGLEDFKPALRDLRDRGQLLPQESRLKRRVRLKNGANPWLYVFRLDS